MLGRSFLVVCCLLAAASTSSEAASARPLVVVSAEAAGKMVFVDPEKGETVAEIPVGPHPRGLALSRDGRRLFVAVAGAIKPGAAGATAATDPAAAGLAIIDVAARKLERKIPAGPSPSGVAVSLDGKTAYVSNKDANELWMVDVGSGALKKKVPVGMAPQGVAMRPDGKVVYVASHDADEVYALDAKTLKLIIRIEAGSRPQSVTFTRRGDLAFAPDEGFVGVSLIDAKRHAMKETVAVRGVPQKPQPPVLQVAVPSPDGKRLYVTTGPAGSVAVVDVAKQSVVGHIDGVGAFTRGIAASADGSKLYTANGASNDVAVIDVATGKVEKRIKVPGTPWNIAILPG